MLINLILFSILLQFSSNINISIKKNNEKYLIYNSSEEKIDFDYNNNNKIKCECSKKNIYNLQKNENDTFFIINLSDDETLNFNKNKLKIISDNPNLIDIKYNIDEISMKYYSLNIIQKCKNSKTEKNWGLISVVYDNKTMFSYLKYCDLNKDKEILSKIGFYFSVLLLLFNAIYYEYLITKTDIKGINSNTNNREIYKNSVFSLIILVSLPLLILYYLRGKLFINLYILLIIQQIFISINIKLEEIYIDYFKIKYSFLSKKIYKNFSLQIYQIIITFISLLITGIYWLTKYWILNNIIVLFLLYSLISIIQIKNFRMCLFFILFYDIFYKYISTFLFQRDNIMVYTISKINLPIKLQIPRFFTENHPLNNCIFFNFTDIIIPAFIIKFLKRFDCLKKINCYYKLGIIIYSITLFISSLNNFIFNYDIPFIFYMIPILSISTLILAYKRKEIKVF